MRRNLARWLLILAMFTLRHAGASEPASGDVAGLELFERSIRPVLVESCYSCHSNDAEKVEGGLLLDSRDGMLKGGESGSILTPGDPEASRILGALQHEDLQMPPDRRLSKEVIANFRQWIQLGAPDPRTDKAALATPAKDFTDWTEARQFWSFQPPQSQPLPRLNTTNRVARRLDVFVQARLQEVGLSPAPAADPQVLARRVAIDLTGLPANASQFGDGLPYEQLVDQLLASTHFGERWARLWLDLARYAEDQAHIVGDDKSLFYPNAYLYRDWIIQAFNTDLSYDQFVRLQLAADMMGDEGQAHLAALGFLGLGPKYYDRGRLEVKAEEWEDRVDTVCRSLLGLTAACARCHDHKFDPISTEDYYSLASIFASTEMFNRPLRTDVEVNDKGDAKNPSNSLHVVRDIEPVDLKVFLRGNVQQQGTPVHRGFLTVLSSHERLEFQQGSGRLELANAMVDQRNPLVARVMVNRIWAELIGQPLVSTPSNFGSQGARPTHPQLLDDLAWNFMRNDWSLKWLIREIVTSSTYQQSSWASEDAVRLDPENQLLSHMHRKRLSVEAWRDSLLVASGQLDLQIGGPSMDPSSPDSRRRTVYSEVSRFQLQPMLAVFDFPDANVHAERRVRTTTPLQNLLSLNHPFMMQQARTLAAQLGTPTTAAAFTDAMQSLFQRTLGRLPTNDEVELVRAFWEQSPDAPEDTWIQLSHALMASNESLFLD